MKIKRIAIATTLFSFFSTTVAHAQQPYDAGTYLIWCYMIENGQVVDLSEMCDRPPTIKSTTPVAATTRNPRAQVTPEQSAMLKAVGEVEATFFCENRGDYSSADETIAAAKKEATSQLNRSDLALAQSPIGLRQIDFIRKYETTMQCPLLDGTYNAKPAR